MQKKQATVAVLKPSKPATLPETTTIYEASKYILGKTREAAVLVTRDNTLTGIVTDKDLTFKVVAMELDPLKTTLRDIMTRYLKLILVILSIYQQILLRWMHFLKWLKDNSGICLLKIQIMK